MIDADPLTPVLRILGALALLHGLPAQQLLDNPGGESTLARRVGSEGGQATYDLPGWETVRGAWVAQSGRWSGVAARDGGAYLRPLHGDDVELAQIVALPEAARAPSHVVAGAWMRTHQGKDDAELVVEVLGAAYEPLASGGTGVRRDREWTWHEVWVAVPPGARHARIALRGKRHRGKLCDAFFDAVELGTFGPGHPPVWAERSARELEQLLDAATDPVERRALQRALVVRDARGAKRVAAAMDAADDPAERIRLMHLLARGADRRTAASAVEAALGAGDAAVREAAFGLLEVVDIDAGKALEKLLRDTADAAIQNRILRALATAGDRDALRALQRFARRDADAAKRVLAAVRAAGTPTDDIYRPLLAPYLNPDADAGLRSAAMEVLGAGADPRFLPHLAELAFRAGSRAVLAGWFRLAAALDTPEALDTMLILVEEDTAHAAEALLDALPAMRSPAALAKIRRDAIGHPRNLVRLAAVRTLAAAGDTGDLRALRAAVADDDPLVSLEAVEAIGSITGSEAREVLERLLARGDGRVAAAAVRAMWERRGDDAAAAVDRLVDAARNHGAWEARAAALQLLPPAAVEAHRDVIGAAFADDWWQVRVAAYEALSKIRSKEVVDTLIARMEGETGTALAFLVDALVALVGVDRGLDPRVWKQWWGIVGPEFQFADREAGAKVERELPSGRTTTYYGIPIRSDRIVFIIDLSGSMNAPFYRGTDERTRLQVAKENLIAVLNSLRPTQSFGLVAFGTGVDPYEDVLFPATPENIAAACEWVKKLGITGATNIYDALEFALGMQGVESIFLLSDGGPSAGKFIDREQIRRVIRRLNQDTRVRVNTVLIGSRGVNARFLEELASENHGVGKTTGDG